MVDPGRVEPVRRRGGGSDFAGIARIGVQRFGLWCWQWLVGVELAAVGPSQRYTRRPHVQMDDALAALELMIAVIKREKKKIDRSVSSLLAGCLSFSSGCWWLGWAVVTRSSR